MSEQDKTPPVTGRRSQFHDQTSEEFEMQTTYPADDTSGVFTPLLSKSSTGSASPEAEGSFDVTSVKNSVEELTHMSGAEIHEEEGAEGPDEDEIVGESSSNSGSEESDDYEYMEIDMTKMNRRATDISKFADTILNIILFMAIAFFTAPVFIIFFSFSLDFLVHLIFYYATFRFLAQGWLAVIGAVFSVFIFTLFLVYLEIGALKFLINACDFRNGFKNQYKDFFDRFFVLFINTFPWYDYLAAKYPLLKRICDREDEEIYLVIRKGFLWLYIVGACIVSFVHSTINGTFIVGYYSDMIYYPSILSLILCLVYEFNGYAIIVLKLIGVRFDGPLPRTPRATKFEPKNSRMYKSVFFHIKRHPHPVMTVLVMIAIVIIVILYIFCSVCYLLAFYSQWEQIAIFLFFQIFFIGICCHSVHIISLEILSYRLFYSPYLYFKKIFQNKWKLAGVVFFIVAGVIVLSSVFISVILELLMSSSMDQPFKAVSNLKPYPICGTEFENMNITDLALMSNLAYTTGDLFNKSFTSYFPLGNWEVVPINSSDDFIGILHFYNPTLDLNVVSTRGTQGLHDILMDVYFYSEITSLQILNMFFPLFTLLPEPRIGDLIAYMYGATEFLFPNQQSYDLVLDAYVAGEIQRLQLLKPSTKRDYRFGESLRSLSKYIEVLSSTGSKILLTGHSLGGGVSQIVASKHNITSVTFAAPGLLYSRKKFEIQNVVDIFTSAVNVRAYTDPIGRTDKQIGMIQWINCEMDNMIACHLLDNYIIELYSGCRLGDPPLVR